MRQGGGRPHQVEVFLSYPVDPDDQALVLLEEPLFDQRLCPELGSAGRKSARRKAQLGGGRRPTLQPTKKYGSKGTVDLNIPPSSWMK